MRLGFSFRHAIREIKSNWRKTGFYTLSIFLGVSALVAVSSFSDNMQYSVEMQSKALKGSDFTFGANFKLPDSVETLTNQMVETGMEKSRVTEFLSMVMNPKTGQSRLVQMRGIEGTYPYYGELVTEPAGVWNTLQNKRQVLIDDVLRFQLDVAVGDSLKIGQATFPIGGTVLKMPGQSGMQFGVGAKVYIPGTSLDETGLIRFGSRVRHNIEMKVPEGMDIAKLADSLDAAYKRSGISFNSYLEREQMLGEAIDRVGNFLGLVSLIALLLGGVGVASSINVFIRQKLDTISILRCVGATGAEVTAAYLFVSIIIGLVGIILGILMGLVIQFTIPAIIQVYIPIDIYVFISWPAILNAFFVGLIITLLFAMFPLAKVLRISPLNALRRDTNEEKSSGFSKRIAAGLGIIFVGAIWLLASYQGGSQLIGSLFTIGILSALGVLYAIAWLVVKITRKLRLKSLKYSVRQSISNLYRPNNQTVTMVLSLGFGVFLISTIFQVQTTLLDQLSLGDAEDRPNMILFDIQASQKDSLESILKSKNLSHTPVLPIMPARLATVNGSSFRSLQDSTDQFRRRNEFRVTYRWQMLKTEEIVSGSWWTEDNGNRFNEVSLENSFADRYGLKLNDEVIFDFQGVQIPFIVTSFRKINWQGFSPNFQVVFKPGPLEKAPRDYATSLFIPKPEDRSTFQRQLVGIFPNVMALDLTVVMETVDDVLNKISIVIQFMGLFSILTGLIVVIGAISNGKVQRIREAALLRTIGGVRKVIQAIFSLEFALLGFLSALTGGLLSYLSSSIIITQWFQIGYYGQFGSYFVVFIITIALMISIGWLINAGLFNKKPLEILRED